MQSSTPKQYLSLHGKPVLRHALEVFESMPEIASILVVLAPQDASWNAELLHGCLKVRVACCGGDTRAASVLNGLKYLHTEGIVEDWVLVHDAARPGIDTVMVKSLMQAVLPDDIGAILALPLADTLKRAGQQQSIEGTISREALWQAQTPQMFRVKLLLEALTQALDRQPTDEAQAIEWMGHQPKLVMGDLKNMKITYKRDLEVVSALMQAAAVHNQQE